MVAEIVKAVFKIAVSTEELRVADLQLGCDGT